MRQVLVIVPKTDEMLGIADALGFDLEHPFGRLERCQKDFYYADFPTTISTGSAPMTAVVVGIRDQGNVLSQLVTRDALDVFDPDVVCLCGTAVGLEGHTRTGSVLVSDRTMNATEWVVQAHRWQVWPPGWVETPRPRPMDVPEPLLTDLQTFIEARFDRKTWMDACRRYRPSPQVSNEISSAFWDPESTALLRGIAGLNHLHRSPRALRALHSGEDRIVAADMETAGFVAACTCERPARWWFVVRGISDFGTRRSKRDAYRRLAAYGAGLFLREFLANGLVLAHPNTPGASHNRLARTRRTRWAPAADRVEAYSLYPNQVEGQEYDGVSKVPVGGAFYRVQGAEEYFGERFASRYSGASLLRLFQKTYPVILLEQDIALAETDVECALSLDENGNPRRFELPGDIKAHGADLLAVHEQMRGAGFAQFDDLSRLASCTRLEDRADRQTRLQMTFEVCNYRDYVLTNYSVPIQRQGMQSLGEVLDEVSASRGGLGSITSELPYANQLGLNALLLTRDGHILYALRSDRVFTFPGLPGPPISGTQMYWRTEEREAESQSGERTVVPAGPATEYYGGTTSKGHGIPSLFRGIMAQGKEEVGLTPSHVKECYLLGIGLDLTRGGLPDAFFVVSLDCDLVEFRKTCTAAHDSWEWKSLRSMECRNGSLDFQQVEARFDQFLKTNVVSPALVTNMYLLLQYLGKK